MAATNAELEMRIRALEMCVSPHQDRRPPLIDPGGETLRSLRRIELGLAALLAHHGIAVDPAAAQETRDR